MAESQIRVLSFNCWGLKYVSKHRSQRIEGIANELANSSYDIIALQEIWVYADYENVQQRISKQLPYSKFFYSGALGAGLAIFSRFPIVATTVHPYSLNGTPIDVAAGDWFVGKAAASVVVYHPVLGHIQIFNTHLFAKGGEDGPEHNRAHRLVNAWEFAKLARHAAELGRYVIALGDFNSIPTTLPMTVIREHAALSDSWLVTHPNESSIPSVSSPLEAITRFGVTADSPLNSYSAGKPLDPHARKFWGKRLDYVLYRQPYRPHISSKSEVPVLRAIDCKVVLTDNVPGFDYSLSDHFGLEATLEIQETPHEELFSERRTPPSDQPITLARAPSELSNASIATVIQAMTTCYQFSRQRAKKEIRIFGLCLFLLVAIIFGTSWLPYSWINPIFLILAIFISWLATTMLYEGFLYGNWECNALMNIIEELEIYRKGLQIQSGVRGDLLTTD
ncbi:Inositol phosphosphingolipids phospholipase C [Hypsizygus marmoreus]|uniref:Inositol phosphosphingolipids phospholipase C n=1 Tax=Hypsizygus marmoreus TaxID=39966 RepID=A0A369K592_HYPMA|nr:Inositol phosphosphingolipids phospholipase C [Hypsizygus marmoreus]